MSKRVLTLYYAEGNNFGDDLIYLTCKNALEKRGMEVVPIMGGTPCIEVIRQANECDFLLFAGGGIIEGYVPNVIRWLKEDYHEMKVPYGVIGLSIGEFDYSFYKEEISFWIRNATFFYTRDQYSADYLKQLSACDKVRAGVARYLQHRL